MRTVICIPRDFTSLPAIQRRQVNSYIRNNGSKIPFQFLKRVKLLNGKNYIDSISFQNNRVA